MASKDTPDDAKVTIEKYWIGTEPTEFDTIEMIEKVRFQERQSEEEESLVSDFFNL